MARRRYDQYCGLARALDVVGERWTLLIIRELLTGPKRYRELLAALEGIGTNLLAQRLKDLEAAGILEREHDRRNAAYQLTPYGGQLEEPVLLLARWGLRLIGDHRPEDRLRSSWGMLGVRALVRPEQTVGITAAYTFEIDDEVFSLHVDDGRVTVGHGAADDAVLVVTTDAATFLQIGAGQLDPFAALETGRLRVEGEPKALLQLAKVMGMVLQAPQMFTIAGYQVPA